MEVPAVSVIIPLYNAEKYIGKCLDSILNQTFQNFEVIVVDDCSTDNSVEIVKSYEPKFGGQMTLLKTEKNSGGGGYVPRNIGLQFSHGEYIFFVDADDFLLETALEILHMAATQYSADVVYTSHYYSNKKNNTFIEVSDKYSFNEKKMTLTINDSEKILGQLFTDLGIHHTPWTKFVNRKLLLENDIEFPLIITGGDFIWTIEVIYHAKRFLRLPIALYFYNESSVSVTRKESNPTEKIVDTFKAFLMDAKIIEALTKKINLLKDNKNYTHYAMRVFLHNCLVRSFEARKNFSTIELYEILCNGLADDLTNPFLFSIVDLLEKNFLKLKEHVDNLENTR